MVARIWTTQQLNEVLDLVKDQNCWQTTYTKESVKVKHVITGKQVLSALKIGSKARWMARYDEEIFA